VIILVKLMKAKTNKEYS